VAKTADEKIDLKIPGIGEERLVRRGDYTALYQALQQQFHRKVAVKLYTSEGTNDSALQRFERECALMGDLSSHPNIVTYFKSGVRRKQPYVVSEWLDEGNYADAVKRGTRLDWRDALNVGIKLAGALESAHRAGLLHRKLKPQDVFLSNFGEPLVGDFQLDPNEASRSGDPYDIMLHAAPELFQGAPATPRSDVYSLASVLYTLIIGKAPFLLDDNEPLVRIKGRAMATPPPDLRAIGVPAPVYAVLAWGLRPHPNDRPPSAQIFGRAMQAAQAATAQPTSRLLVRPQTPADRALPTPTLPPEAMSILAIPQRAPIPPRAPSAPPAPSQPAQPAPPPGSGQYPQQRPLAPPGVAGPPPFQQPAPPPPGQPGRPAQPQPQPPAGQFAPPQLPSAPPAVPASAVPASARVGQGYMTPSAVVEQVRTLLRRAARAYANTADAARMEAIEARLDEPLRVAIAGKVKAGKSTLLNGLVGEELAPTDASECTKIVTWYIDGLTYRATLHLRNGTQRPTAFSRESGAIDVELQGERADDVDHIVVEWPSSALSELSLIDTPGIASISTGISARTQQFMLAEGEQEGQADAVIYLMRHLHPSDVRFLEAFHDDRFGKTNPINAIGILSRADELAGGQEGALDAAAKVARRYCQDPQVRRLCQTVIPIAGLLAQASATLRQSEYNLMARLAGLPQDTLDMLLASADRFIDGDLVANVVSTDREMLVRRFGLYGVSQSITMIRQGTVDSAPALAQRLLEMSGLSELRRVLITQFAGRRDVIKAQAALQAVEQRLRASPPPADREGLLFELERLRSTAHVFAEIQLFAAIRSSAIGFRDDELTAVECLLGGEGYSPATRLGLPPTAEPELIRSTLYGKIQQWRTRAESPLAGREMADAAQVLVRSCEGMLLAMNV
jgi:serine/threonine protein kinase